MVLEGEGCKGSDYDDVEKKCGLSVKSSTWHRGEVVACAHPWQILIIIDSWNGQSVHQTGSEDCCLFCFVLLNIIVLLCLVSQVL